MFQCSDMAAFWYIEIGIGTDKYSIADIWLDITII